MLFNVIKNLPKYNSNHLIFLFSLVDIHKSKGIAFLGSKIYYKSLNHPKINILVYK